MRYATRKTTPPLEPRALLTEPLIAHIREISDGARQAALELLAEIIADDLMRAKEVKQ